MRRCGSSFSASLSASSALSSRHGELMNCFDRHTWSNQCAPVSSLGNAMVRIRFAVLMSVLFLAGCSRFPHSIDRVSQDILLTSERPTNSKFTWIRLLSVEPDGHTKLAVSSGETWEAMPGEMFHKKYEVLPPGRGAYQLLSVAPERGEPRIRVFHCVYR